MVNNLNKNNNSGQALIFSVMFFLFISLIVVSGLVFSSLKGSALAADLITSKKSYFLAESGVEDIVFRASQGMNYSAEEVISLDGFFATTTVQSVADNIEVASMADALKHIRKINAILTASIGASFNYGLQIGDGGLEMKNLASVTGNVYSNGIIYAEDDNEILGDVVSAGPLGSVEGVYATGSVYAHDIVGSEVEGDAYYQTLTNTTVLGTIYPESDDQPVLDFPISDEKIEEWEASAEVSITTSPCPYEIDSAVDLGPVKIECDLIISGSAEITLYGPVWVEGDLTIENNSVVKVAPSLEGRSVAIIADNSADSQNSGSILLQNNVEFYGSGQEGSYVMLVSQNNSAENGGSNIAIEIENNAAGDLLLYASHGEILLQNNGELKEVTAYKINLQNLANVIYESGLASLLFDSGPGGSVSVSSWEEVE
ncbi:hypothetical protein ACFLZC_02535 [Patescibacteria group bacterium]